MPLLLLLLGCSDKPSSECDCRVNDDGTLNFRAEEIQGSLVIKAGGSAYTKVRPGEVNMREFKERGTFWKDLKTGKSIESGTTIEALEACSLLHEWRVKGMHETLMDDTASTMLEGSTALPAAR